MENKAFMFMPAWITPLTALPAEERWNVVVSIVEYASCSSRSIILSPAAEMAFAYISADIDRMKKNYLAVCEKRKAAAESRWSKQEGKAGKTGAPKPKAGKLKTKTCVQEDDSNDIPYDDSQLLTRFFDESNHQNVEELAMRLRLPIEVLRLMALEITCQWGLSEKTHQSYQDAASHLIFALVKMEERERNSGTITRFGPMK